MEEIHRKNTTEKIKELLSILAKNTCATAEEKEKLMLSYLESLLAVIDSQQIVMSRMGKNLHNLRVSKKQLQKSYDKLRIEVAQYRGREWEIFPLRLIDIKLERILEKLNLK